MRIIQLPPVISTRGNTPPSAKPNGTSSSPTSSNDISSSSSSNNNKHFLIIPSRRLTDNNNSRKTNGQNGSIPTCERLDRRGIRTFVGHAQETKPEETMVSSNCRSVMTSYGERFKDNEADKENSTPEGDREEEETNVRMSPGHVRNMIALFSSGSPNDLDSRSRSKSSEWKKGASPQPVTNGSEPSLGSRNDNQVVGLDSASKRTLVSQENMSPSNRPDTATTTPTAAHGVSDNTHNATETASILPTMNDLDPERSPEVTTLNFDNSPAKTPSYLNASRLASGYSPYSSYTPVLQARNIKVLRKSESESDSSLSSTPRTDESRVTLQGQGHSDGQSDNQQQQQQPITNGNVVRNDLDSERGDLDLVDSARISSSNVKVTSRTQPQRPLSGDLDGGMSRLPRGEESSGLLENGRGLGNLTRGGEDLQLNLPREEKLHETGSPDTPAKDGHYFVDVMRREEKRIQELCSLAESDLQNNHSEEVNGKLRAAIGKANLLTSKKFNQFKGLCQKSIERDEADPFPIMPKDLVGFWDMVSIQVDDVHTMFNDIERMRLSGWTQVQTPTTIVKSAVGKGGVRKSPRSKTTTSQSQRAQEAAKARDRAREEARKRLLAAKKAGRIRKRSNSDKDEIEIFVAE